VKHQHRAYAYAILAVLCWSTIGSAFKISLRYLDFLSLLLWSSFVAVCVLFLTILFQWKAVYLKRLKNKDFLRSAILGFLNPFLYYVVLLRAYELLRAQEAGTLNYIWPLVLVLLSIPLLKQKISWWSILAVFVSFTGIIIISTHGYILSMRFSSPVGVILAVGSAFFWALYWIYNVKDPGEAVIKLFLNFCFGFIYIVITYSVVNFGQLQAASLRLFDWGGILGAVYIGVFEMGITFVFWLMALKLSVTTAKVSNLIFLSPFISLIFIHFIVGETIFFSTFIGLVFIVAGILLQQNLKR
jgi:drug/metabolite transporter (DMT)-like permease